MAGPGGAEVGRVSIRVVPDTAKFARELKAKLSEIRDFKVDVTANTDPLDRDVEKSRRKQESKHVQIPVDPITRAFNAQVRAAVAEAGRNIAVNIPTTLDGERARRQASAISAEIERLVDPVNFPTDIKGATETRARVAALTVELQAIADANTVHVPVDIDRRGGIARIGRAFRALTSGSTLASGALRGVPTIVTSLGTAAASALPSLLNIVSSLGALGGIVALLPAALFAVVIPLGVLALALKGTGKAFGTALSGNAADFNKALEGATPAVRDALKAVRTLKGPLADLRKSVQEAFFDKLTDSIRNFAPVIGKLNPSLTKVSSSLGSMASKIFNVITAAPSVSKLSGIFTDVGKAIGASSPGIAALVNTIITLGRVGSAYLVSFGNALSGVLTRFDAFITRSADAGKVNVWIDNALKALRDLGSVAASVASVFGGIFKAASAAGGSSLGGLAIELRAIADVVNGPVFQTGLTTIFQGLNNLGTGLSAAFAPIGAALAALAPALSLFLTAVGQIAGTALTALANAIVILAPQITALATQALPVLVQGFVTLAPVLLAVATYISQNTPLFLALAAAFLYMVAPVTLVIAAIALLALNFQNIMTFLAPVIAYVQTFVPIFQTFGSTIVATGAQLMPVFQGIVDTVVQNWPQISAIITQVMSTVRDVVTLVLTLISTYFKVYTALIIAVWRAIGPQIAAVFAAVLGIIKGVLNVIQGVVRFFLALLKGNWKGALSALGQIATGAWQIVVGIFNGAVALLEGAVKLIIAGIKGAFGKAKDLLSDIGQKIIDGLVAGLKGAAHLVTDAASSIVDKIPKTVRKIMGISSPSKVMRTLGRYVGQGFADGLNGTGAQISSVARSLSNRIRDAFLAKKIGRDQRDDALSLISSQTKRLKKLALERLKVANQLKSAKEKLTAAVKQRADFAANLKTSIASSANITSGVPTDGTLTAAKVIASLKAKAAATVTYQKALAKLQKLGLNSTSFRQLLDAGVEAGGATATALIAGGKSAVSQVNSIQKQVNSAASGLSNSAADYLYGAGVSAARGLVNGLERIDLTKASKRIADQLIKALKQELKIKSPSRVTRDEIGVPTGEGIVAGLLRTRRAVNGAVNGLIDVNATKLHPSGRTAAGGPMVAIQNMYALDPDEAASRIERRQRDALAVHSLGGAF